MALLLRSVVDYAIYMLDADGYVRSWNTGGEQIKGYSASEIVGQHFSRFYTPEDVALGLPEEGLATARDAGRFEAEGWRVRKDGSRFRASVVIDPVYESGRLVGFAKVTRDITERYHAEQALEQAREALLESRKMESVGKLTLGLAHDFNNLITIIVNSLDLIEGSPTADARTRMLVETALQACDRGALLTRQLLAFGRGQALAPELCDIAELLENSMDLYRRACAGSVHVELEPAAGLPPVWVDRAQFEAAILNLVANSRDAMPDGGCIRIGARALQTRDPAAIEDGERLHVCVEVTDDGQGIAPDIQPHVFEPFFTTKEVGKGSGLGLSQVFGFAAQSGGYAELHSQVGQGTRVRICLPVGEEAA
ncbi:PAS domain-containing sensor histidine kinase [Luteimonas sp. MC1895]|uniref:two-component system sensor histidine kinase NtrB n=1 Tax=Luteimonas sp. MC1895 TaxID=2819513 RepID=UPI0018F07F61|nr:PAS domain-containing sensor histidine kinase [Luteimonas sp. MC1895]MBJ6980049.1 PAS domain S-box protein [Luteimonas sp. MC1895]